MTRLFFPFVFFLVVVQYAKAQEPCAFDQIKRRNQTGFNQSELIISKGLQKRTLKSADSIKIIPVVIHVIHNGGTENISDAQINSQIDVLNEDYRKMAGTKGDGNGVDTKIQFCLAKITPDGRCTNGIVRIKSALSNHQTYQRTQLSQLSFWDNTRYLNVYVVKNISNGSGTLGYASFPGGPNNEDGIVVRHDFFGRKGTAAASLGRTTTHEAGHWLGLYHTFNGGCGNDVCTDGDYVCDTPPVANPNFGCPTINSCSNDSPNLPDQIQNYMDYSDDNCKSMFSAGQASRMTSTLTNIRYKLWSDSNLVATGCDSNYVAPSNCPVIADFTANSTTICNGGSVLFTNKSLNNPKTYSWYFPGGNPATSTATNPTVIYSAVGTYSVTLVAMDSLGQKDSLVLTDYLTVETPSIGRSLPYFEGFESATFPPNGITVENVDNGISWERDTVAVADSGFACVKINNLINTNYGQSDALILPAFDLSNKLAYLQFNWAYARSDANYSDELIVLASKDCGVSWTQVFYRTGNNLVTGPTQTTPYIPDGNTVWKKANINLTNYSGNANVLLKIVNVTDGGNNLYIDNINLSGGTVGIKENEGVHIAEVFPNPNNGLMSFRLKGMDPSNDLQLEIFGILGDLISKVQLNSSETQVDISANAPGMYLYKISTHGQTLQTNKLLIY